MYVTPVSRSFSASLTLISRSIELPFKVKSTIQLAGNVSEVETQWTEKTNFFFRPREPLSLLSDISPLGSSWEGQRRACELYVYQCVKERCSCALVVEWEPGSEEISVTQYMVGLKGVFLNCQLVSYKEIKRNNTTD